MSTYVIGDVQGCHTELAQLLAKVNYDPSSDHLWFVGDMINRGPNNVEVMDLIIDLPNVTCVLGNHDLHFLAVAHGQQRVMRSDTFQDLLDSPRLAEYIDYLLQLPLLHYVPANDILMVHAGIPPQMDVPTCLSLASEVETILQSNDPIPFFAEMYGNQPEIFDDSLTGMDRLRVITNCFTRIRYCTPDGHLELTHKTEIEPAGYAPWFSFERTDEVHVLFGHWAALEGEANAPFVTALDTGCVWGRELMALKLEDNTTITVPAA